MFDEQKNRIKNPVAKTITHTTKGRPKKGQKDVKPKGTKEGRELVPFMVESYFTHSPSNVICMQIVKFNSNKRFRTSIICQCNLFFYNKS
jgi:hypothetical protein